MYTTTTLYNGAVIDSPMWWGIVADFLRITRHWPLERILKFRELLQVLRYNVKLYFRHSILRCVVVYSESPSTNFVHCAEPSYSPAFKNTFARCKPYVLCTTTNNEVLNCMKPL